MLHGIRHFLLKYVSFSQVTVRGVKSVFALKKKKAFENSVERAIPAKHHARERLKNLDFLWGIK